MEPDGTEILALGGWTIGVEMEADGTLTLTRMLLLGIDALGLRIEG